MKRSLLSQPYDQGSVDCHESGHTKPKSVSPPCPSHDACGLRNKHPELNQSCKKKSNDYSKNTAMQNQS